MKFRDKLKSMGSCKEALEWIQKRGIKTSWRECDRGDWLIWYAQKTWRNDLQLLTLAKARCARLIIHLMKDDKSIEAIYVAEQFGLGKATIQELETATATALIAYQNDNSSLTSAAYHTVNTITDPDHSYAAIVDTAASTSVYMSERRKVLSECADIIRETYKKKLS